MKTYSTTAKTVPALPIPTSISTTFCLVRPHPASTLNIAFVQAMLPEISLDEVNALASIFANEDNRATLVIAPEKADVALPTEEELAAAFATVAAESIDPYEDQVVEAELIAEIPEPATIVDEQMLEELGVTLFELENGVTVLMKPTEFREDEVLFSGVSRGGSSLVSDEDFPEASLVADIVDQSGLAEFEFNDLIRLLTGKTVQVSPAIRELTEGLDGSASAQDLETLFQLIYLYFTAPRADEAAFLTIQDQVRAELVNRDLNPRSALSDAYLDARYGDTIRRGPLPLEAVDALDRERGMEIYLDRFGDASDFYFVFVGSFEPETLKELARVYLGTLPAAGRAEEWRDVAPDPPGEATASAVFKGQEEQSIVQIIYTGDMENSTENEILTNALQTVLDIRVREELREELGGVYSPFAIARLDSYPDELYLAAIGYSADPERVQELLDATYALVEEVQTEGVSQKNVDKAKETLLRSREEALEDNNFWLSELRSYAVDQEVDLMDILRFEELVDAVTAEELQRLAQEMLAVENSIQVVLYPQAYEGQTE